MGDPYMRYGGGGGGGGSGGPSSTERGHMPKAPFPGYMLPETSTPANYNSFSSIDPQTASSVFLHKDILPSRTGAYGVDGMPSVHAEPSIGASVAGASYKGYRSSFEDPKLYSHPGDVSGRTFRIPNVGYDRPNSMTRTGDNPFPGYLPSETSTLDNHNSYRSTYPQTPASDFSHKDIFRSHRTGAYVIDDMSSDRAEPNTSGLGAGASYECYSSSLKDRNLLAHPSDVASGRTSGIPDVGYDRSNSMTRTDGNPVPGYLSSETSTLAKYNSYSFIDPQTASSDLLHKDILPARRTGAYGIDDLPNVRAEISSHGLVAGARYKGYPSSIGDPNLLPNSRDVASGRTTGISDVGSEKPNSITKIDGNPVPAAESNVLFVDGLPTDCTRREIGHLFRPFIGFREIRLIHKERKRRGDKDAVLCFIEFTDSKCALTAMETLQGYKFDYKKENSPTLRIHFAHFPFRPPSD